MDNPIVPANPQEFKMNTLLIKMITYDVSRQMWIAKYSLCVCEHCLLSDEFDCCRRYSDDVRKLRFTLNLAGSKGSMELPVEELADSDNDDVVMNIRNFRFHDDSYQSSDEESQPVIKRSRPSEQLLDPTVEQPPMLEEPPILEPTPVLEPDDTLLSYDCLSDASPTVTLCISSNDRVNVDQICAKHGITFGDPYTSTFIDDYLHILRNEFPKEEVEFVYCKTMRVLQTKQVELKNYERHLYGYGIF